MLAIAVVVLVETEGEEATGNMNSLSNTADKILPTVCTVRPGGILCLNHSSGEH